MLGLMMQQPLLISNLLRHADSQHGSTEIVTRTVEGPIQRSTYRELHRRTRQLANALRHLGLQPGERVATLAWNTQRHLETYYAVSGSGAVVHTVNPRLFDEQIVYIINHASAGILLFDASFAPIVARIRTQLTHIRHFVLMSDRAHAPQDFPGELLVYEDLLHAHSKHFEWPQFDENSAAGLCYTSGTTGHPKGVLYSHRSSVLHAYATALPDSFGLSARDAVMPVVPMYHVNAWGLPYSALLVGAKLVLPGPGLDGRSLLELIEGEGVTFSAGVPTVWQPVLQLATETLRGGQSIGRLERLLIGGSACPPAMMDTFADHGVRVLHSWGMTEISPIGVVNTPKNGHAQRTGAEDARRRHAKQGRPLPGVELEILDDDGEPLPHDGVSFGELVVRGAWVCRQYFGREEGDGFINGWFRTGDVATLDAEGYMQITDRAKDVIKSGGEWISSIDLENILIAHPAVAEAAALSVAHPKWDERPLMAVVLKPGATLSREEMRAFYDGKVARWWIPDDLAVVGAIPYTATGKMNKLKLREQFRDHRWPTEHHAAQAA